MGRFEMCWDFAFLATLLSLAAACGTDDTVVSTGSDYSTYEDVSETDSLDSEYLAKSTAACPVADLQEGTAALEIYSTSLGGEIPVSFDTTCDAPGEMFTITASDDLSTFHLEVSNATAGDQRGSGSFEFEDLATFDGGCDVCLDGASGTLSCPSLLWRSGGELVKASITGSFRCGPR